MEIISRDRAGAYVDGASQGAPDAVQVADRFHLFRNLTDALQKILEREHARLRRAANEAAAPPPDGSAPMPEPRLFAGERRKQENRARRLGRYEEVVELKRRGLTNVDIARRTCVERRTVTRWLQHGWLQHGCFPERKPQARRSKALDPYLDYIEQRWQQGVRNASLLFREIRARGYPGTSYTAVRDLVQGWRHADPPTAPAGPRPLASVRQSAWLLTLSDEERSPEQRSYLAALREAWPQVHELERLAREFIGFFHHQDASTISTWIREAEKTPLRRFARGLFSDLRAIRAAIELPWSNDSTEAHINRLKSLKRQMYGRASFDLLRARLFSAA